MPVHLEEQSQASMEPASGCQVPHSDQSPLNLGQDGQDAGVGTARSTASCKSCLSCQSQALWFPSQPRSGIRQHEEPDIARHRQTKSTGQHSDSRFHGTVTNPNVQLRDAGQRPLEGNLNVIPAVSGASGSASTQLMPSLDQGSLTLPTSGSCRDFAVGGPGSWLRNRGIRQPQTFDVELDRIMHLSLHFLPRAASSHATRQIRRISREAGGGPLNNDQISAHFSPDCLRMLFCVPGARSSPGLPGTVTKPCRVACLYCRWLPRVRSRYQPPASIMRMISRTFTELTFAGANRTVKRGPRTRTRVDAGVSSPPRADSANECPQDSLAPLLSIG